MSQHRRFWYLSQKPPLNAHTGKSSRPGGLTFGLSLPLIPYLPETRALVRLYLYTGWSEPFLLTNSISTKILCWVIYEPRHQISNNVVCATSKGSDKPAHMRSLVRAFANGLNIL